MYDNLALKFVLGLEFLLDVIIQVIDKEIWDMAQNDFGRFRWIDSFEKYIYVIKGGIYRPEVGEFCAFLCKY